MRMSTKDSKNEMIGFLADKFIEFARTFGMHSWYAEQNGRRMMFQFARQLLKLLPKMLFPLQRQKLFTIVAIGTVASNLRNSADLKIFSVGFEKVREEIKIVRFL